MIKLGDGHIPELFNFSGTEAYYDAAYNEDINIFYEEDLEKRECRLSEHMASWVIPKLPELLGDCAEIGIGNGAFSKAVFNYDTAPWDGYDLSSMACEVSKDLYQSTTKHDINNSPLPKKYDVIFMCGMFTERLLDATCIQNIVDSLNEGGILIASFHRRTNYWVNSGWYYDTKFELVDFKNEFVSGLRETLVGRENDYNDIKQLQLVNFT